MLQDYAAENYTYNGKKMTEYDATQQQRYIERQIRRWKREAGAMSAAGQDNSEAQAKVAAWQGRMRDFLSQTGLKRDRAREQIGKKAVAIPGKSGIIKRTNGNGGSRDVQYVGKIDKELYSCVAENITTDEVILTDERVRHIKERRGEEFYEMYRPLFADILADPDYIFPDDRPNTVLACKTFERNGATVNLVVRLAAAGDDPQYKNSIITAIKENDKRFAQRIRNNKSLYKKE